MMMMTTLRALSMPRSLVVPRLLQGYGEQGTRLWARGTRTQCRYAHDGCLWGVMGGGAQGGP